MKIKQHQDHMLRNFISLPMLESGSEDTKNSKFRPLPDLPEAPTCSSSNFLIYFTNPDVWAI